MSRKVTTCSTREVDILNIMVIVILSYNNSPLLAKPKLYIAIHTQLAMPKRFHLDQISHSIVTDRPQAIIVVRKRSIECYSVSTVYMWQMLSMYYVYHW